jgi:hypothetical protein
MFRKSRKKKISEKGTGEIISVAESLLLLIGGGGGSE